VAVEYGAEVPFLRPATLADDYTGTNAVVRHAITWIQDHGHCVAHACCIYATAPFVSAADLRDGLARLRESGKSFAFSVTSFPFPIQRAIRITAAGTVDPVFPQHATSRSQDLEETFHDAGQFYWGTTAAFLGDTPLFSAASVPVVLPRHRVQDIDTLEDWDRAELLYQVLHGQTRSV
jgi:N-acylneuraminate cytidylyltransferase